MLVTTLVSLMLWASVALGYAVDRRSIRRCGAPDPDDDQKEAAQGFAIKEAFARKGGWSNSSAIKVDVVMHVVAKSKNPVDGYISDEVLRKQLDVLNTDYARTRVSFKLKNITRTINRAWSEDDSEMEMKRALRQGDYKTLNIYYLTYLGDFFGYCYLPKKVVNGSDIFFRDGCSILVDTVPGGSLEGFNLGKTTTHEVGHWLGLYHTFEGGCEGDGDFVLDTPAQASNSQGCPIGRDSCPDQSGLDPIHNFMDYSDDACYESFSPGQVERIRSSWKTYRL